MSALPLTGKNASSWRALCLAAALWLAALVLIHDRVGKILSYLLPGADSDLGLFLCQGQALFIALLAPLAIKVAAHRWQAVAESAAFLLITLSPLALGFALASRITPLTLSAACRGAACLAAFALFCFALWVSAARWYFSLQALVAGAGPWAAFFLGELSRQRGVDLSGLKALCAPSVFCALVNAMQTAAPARSSPTWSTSAALWLLAAAVCFVLRPVRKTL